MALTRIQPNTDGTTLVTRLNRKYKDVDLNFSPRPGTLFDDGIRRGDIYKKEQVRAIDQSIQNILLTNKMEKPFDPKFGSDLRRLLFELDTTISEQQVSLVIESALREYEPRVEVLEVNLYDPGASKQVPRGIDNVFFYSTGGGDERYSLVVTVVCKILNTGEEFSSQVNMSRLR